jgi:hypothetical protein
MSTMTRPLPLAYGPNAWLGHSGKASWYPNTVQFKLMANQFPAGALAAGVLITGGAPMLGMLKPRLMMDPSDPTTWQRPYRFTGGQIG